MTSEDGCGERRSFRLDRLSMRIKREEWRGQKGNMSDKHEEEFSHTLSSHFRRKNKEEKGTIDPIVHSSILRNLFSFLLKDCFNEHFGESSFELNSIKTH